MTRLLIILGFIPILVGPGRLPSFGYVNLNHLGLFEVLLMVASVSLIQAALLLAVPNHSSWITSKRDALQNTRLVGRVVGWRHRGAQYGLLGILPLLPIGGGLWLAGAIGFLWELPTGRTTVLLAAVNTLSYGLWFSLTPDILLHASQYLLAGAVAVLTATTSYRLLTRRQLIPAPVRTADVD